MDSLKNKIVMLRSQGLKYDEIAKTLGCAKSTVAYHVNDAQRGKSNARQAKARSANALLRKTENYQKDTIVPEKTDVVSTSTKRSANKVTKFHYLASGEYTSQKFNYRDVEEKLGDSPICYLTGEAVDLSSPATFEFDHILPRSKGGSNDLENLGLTTREANRAKNDMELEDFLELCEKILKHHGRM